MKPNPSRSDGAPKSGAEAQQPIESRRNLYCKFYDKCLDAVVKKGWQGFNCTECDGYLERDDEQMEKRRTAGLTAYATQRKS